MSREPGAIQSVLALTAPVRDGHSAPLMLDPMQYRRLIDDACPYTLIDHFVFTDKELLERVPATDQYRFMRECMRVAHGFGMRDGKRILMICTWALLSGEGFHAQPAWHKRLKDFAAGRRSAREIGDEVWPMEETWE